MAPGQQFCFRAEHRVQRRYTAAGVFQALEPVAQWRLQRPYVEDETLGFALRQFRQYLTARCQRRRNDDNVIVDTGFLPVAESARAGFDAGVSDTCCESL